jgi:phosphoribosylformylglycinamidine cyclo-ligase
MIMSENLSYKKSGVDIDVADETKKAIAKCLDSGDSRVLNRIGAFASLVDGRFEGYTHPVLVLKTEEPGSKQKLAFQYGRISSICYDLINHLINDIIVMGAEPVYVQDCIICGKIEPDVVKELVNSMSAACREQGCTLVGGETSEQPGVVEASVNILSASIVGVVDKEQIVDGSKISKDDVVLAAASNGVHTNGYSLIRALIDRKPEILKMQVDKENFFDTIMRPHKCYYQEFRGLWGMYGLHGLAHITGGGIQGNLNRILPADFDAFVDKASIRIPKIFNVIRNLGGVSDADMLRTFNMGVGMAIVCEPSAVKDIQMHLDKYECECYQIGQIIEGTGKVSYKGELKY